MEWRCNLSNDNEKLKKIIEEVYQRAKNDEIEPCGEVSGDRYYRAWLPAEIFTPFMTITRLPRLSFQFLQFPSPMYTHCKTKKFIRKLLTYYKVKTLEQALDLYTKAEYIPISNGEYFILNNV